MNPDESTRISNELAAMRSELDLLRAEIARYRDAPTTSLKRHNRCPQCQGTSILHCSEIRDHGDADHEPMSIQRRGVFKVRTIGTFEVYVCRQCEWAEWYVKGASDVVPEELDKANRKLIRIIENETPDNGPFR